MKIGSLIKFHRTKQGLTQQTLADGICSVPHLSKIENNSKEANEETIRLLLERLSIDLQDVEKLEVEIRDLLKKFADEMYYLELEELKSTYTKLKENEEIIPFTEQLYMYELYKARYFLMMHENEKAERQLKWLHAHKQNFSQLEKHLHSYISALALAIRGKVEDAEQQLSQLIENALLTPEMVGELNYNFSVLKSSLNQYGQAIYYGKNALQQFKEDYNFTRIVQVQMLLAISYSRAMMFNEAFELYDHLLRNSKLLNLNDNYPKIYHNMGDLYHTMKDYEKAQMYFNKAMHLVPINSEFYMLCLYNRAISEKFAGEDEISVDSFNQLQKIASEFKNTHYQLFAKFYSLQMNDEKLAMEFLETKILPFTKSNKELIESHKHFTNVLVDYYKETGKFDKAIELLN